MELNAVPHSMHTSYAALMRERYGEVENDSSTSTQESKPKAPRVSVSTQGRRPKEPRGNASTQGRRHQRNKGNA